MSFSTPIVILKSLNDWSDSFLKLGRSDYQNNNFLVETIAAYSFIRIVLIDDTWKLALRGSFN